MEIRRLKADEFEQAIQLADETFRGQGHISMGEAFPHVFSAELKQSFGAFDGEKLVSFIGLVPATIRVGEAVLTVFSIGAVCTHENYRQQGISTKVLHEVYHHAEEATASLLFVSGDRGMYMRNQCYHFGQVKKYTLDKTSVAENGYRGDIRIGQPADIFHIDRLRSATTVRFDSSIWEWRMLVEAGGYASIFKMTQALYVASRAGVVEGYAVIAMPTSGSTKEQAIVTEWAGDSQAVYGILQHVLENNSVQEIELTLPWHEEFYDENSQHSCEILQNAGTIHIVNPARLIEQLMPYLCEKNRALAQSLTVETVDGNQVVLHYHNSKMTLGLEEFVKLVFDLQQQPLLDVFPVPLPHTEGLYFV